MVFCCMDLLCLSLRSQMIAPKSVCYKKTARKKIRAAEKIISKKMKDL